MADMGSVTVFRSTPPCRGRRRGADHAGGAGHVSIHAPVQGATILIGDLLPLLAFRSTPPCRGRPPPSAAPRPPAAFRSTPPCRGRRELERPLPRGDMVSIHAPVQGATAVIRCKTAAGNCFDPRPRAGGDAQRLEERHPRRVSIHAPVQGATPRPRGRRRTRCRFDPRPRAGGDTDPRPRSRPGRCFDPRPRAGGDPDAGLDRGRHPVSIHAPVQGATLRPACRRHL